MQRAEIQFSETDVVFSPKTALNIHSNYSLDSNIRNQISSFEAVYDSQEIEIVAIKTSLAIKNIIFQGKHLFYNL